MKQIIRKNPSPGIQYTTYNNRCIKGVLKNTEDDAQRAIVSILNKVKNNKDINNYDVETFVLLMLGDDGFLKESYHAKARANVSAGDVFDEKRGKELVKARLLEKYHKDFDKAFVSFLTKLRTYEASIIHYCRSHNIKIDSVPSVEYLESKIYESGYKAHKN